MAEQWIFVTGGASGIGRATAVHFAAKGWRVALADIDAAGMAETEAMIGVERCPTYILDVTRRADWAEAMQAFARDSGGRLDCLFNNAGLGIGGPIGTMQDADIDLVLDVNLHGVIHGIRAALPLLRDTAARAGRAAILSTCSAAGIYGSAGLSIYSATKFAVRGLTEALDIELAPENIRVRSIMPGFIDTPLLDRVEPISNRSTREIVRAAGLEFTPVEKVAEAAWDAVHGDRLHTVVGPTARRLAFAARWMPGRLRRRMGVLAAR